MALLEAQVTRLQEEVDAQAGERSPIARDAERERDDLRAEVVTLRDSLARLREAGDLQRAADKQTSRQVEHLLAAIEAGNRADALRRKAFDTLRGALYAQERPDHLGQTDLVDRESR